MDSAKKRWINRLEKILDAMPKDVEIVVEASTYDIATIRLMPLGSTSDLEEDNDHDRAAVVSKIEEVELCSFYANRVIANSENM